MNKKGLLKSFIFAICLVFSMALLFAVGAKFNAVSGTGNEINLTINFDDKCEVSGEINAEGYESIFDTASFTSSTMGAGVDKDNGKYYTYIYVNAATGTYFEKGSEQYGYAFPSMTVKVNGCAVEAYIGTTEEVNFLPIPSSTASENIRMAIKVTFDKVVYKSNNGTGDAPTALFVQNGSKTTAATTTLSRTGYTFKNWNTKSNGEGTAYATGAEVAVTGNVALYAQWNLAISTQPTNASPTVATDAAETITYQWKKADGTAVADATSDTFDGLGQDAGEYYCTLTSSTGETVDSEKVKVAAVEFDGNGNTSGEAPAALTNLVGKTVTVPSCPTELKYTNKKFVKWNDGTNDYEPAATYTIQENGSTLKAQWEDKTAVTLDNTKSEFTFGDNNIAFATTGNSEAITTGFKIEYYVGGEYTENAPVNAGIYTVKVSRAEDETYKSFEQVLTTVGETKAGLIINPKEVSVAWVEKTYTYNGDAQTVTASYKDKDGADIALTVTYGTDVVFKNVATYTATASFANNETNYVLKDDTTIKEYTINKFEVAVTWCTTTYTYNGQAQAVTATYADAKGNVTNLKVSYGTDVVFMNAGKYNAAVAFETTEEENNYGFKSDTTIAKEYSIAAKVVEIAWCANNFTYNGKGQEVTATYKDVANADIALAVSYGEGVTFKNAGNYTAKAAFANTDNADGNYALPEDVEEDYEIKKYTITIDWCNTEYTYTGSKQTVTASYVSFESATPVALSVAYSNVNVAKADFINAGNYKCTASFAAETDNYALPEVNYKDYTISPKEVEVVWCENVYEYNGKEQEVTAKYVDVKGADVALTVSFGDDVTFKNAGEYNATAAFANNETNYVLKADTTTKAYNIAKYTITINWCNTVYTYNGEAQDVIATYDNLDGSKDIALAITYSGKGTEFKVAGDYTATAAFASTEEEANYKLPTTVTNPYTMNKLEIAKPVLINPTDGKYPFTGNEITPNVDNVNSNINVTGTTSATTAGIYTAYYDIADKDNVQWKDKTNSAINLVWEIKELERKSADNSILLENEAKGFEAAVTLDASAKAASSLDTDEVKKYNLTEKEKVSLVYDIKLMKDSASIQPDGEIVIKMLIPSVIDIAKITKFIHYHDAANVFVDEFDPKDIEVIDGKNYYVYKTSTLSHFAFATDTTTDFEYLQMELLASVQETLIQLTAKGYDIDVAEEISAMSTCTTKAVLENAYNDCLTEINAQVKAVETYRTTIKSNVNTYATTKKVIVTADYYTVLETVNTTAKLDAVEVILKAEIDNVVAEKANLKTRFDAVDSAISDLDSDVSSDYSNLLSAIEDAQEAIEAILNDSTNGLAKINTNIDECEAYLDAAITTAKEAIVAALGEKTTELKNYIDALEDKLNTKFAATDANVDAAEEAIKNLVNTETSAIDTAVAELNTKVGTVETNLTAAIAQLKTDLVAALNAQTTELKAYVDTLEGKLNTKFAATDANVDAAEEAIKNLVNTETSAIDTAIAELDTKVAAVETNILAAIAQLKTDLVAELGDKTTELKNYIDALEINLGIEFDNVESAIETAQGSIESLVNSETDDIDTAIAALETNVAAVEFNLTVAIDNAKSEIVNELGSKTTELKNYIDALEDKLNTKFAATDANVDAAEEAIKNLVNTETSAIDTAIVELNAKVGTVETNILTAIAQLKIDLVAELGSKTTELKNYIDALEDKLNTKFAATDANVDAAEEAIKNLVNIETTAIDTAIAELNSKVGTVETNLTAAIANAKAEIVNELGSKTTELKNYIDALEDKLNTKFAATDANVDAAEEAIKNLVNTETSAIDTAIAALDTDVAAVETNILAAIAQLKTDLVAALNAQTTELKAYVDALEGKLNTKFTNTNDNIDAAEEAIKTLVNTETTAIDTAIAALDTKVGTVDTHVTNAQASINNAIISLKNELVSALATKTNELKDYTDALESSLNIKFNDVNTAIANAKTAITELVNTKASALTTAVNNQGSSITSLVNTETSAIDTAIAALDTKVGTVETNLKAALTSAENTLTALINAKKAELAEQVTAFKAEDKAAYEDTLAKIADLKAAVKATEEFLDKELGDSEDELTKSVKEAKDAVDASYESLNVKLAEYNDTFVADMNDKYMKVFVIICSIAALSLITLIIVIVKKNK